jgi:hypothetical protein
MFFYNFPASYIACVVKTTVVRQAVHGIHSRKKSTEPHTFEFFLRKCEGVFHRPGVKKSTIL